MGCCSWYRIAEEKEEEPKFLFEKPCFMCNIKLDFLVDFAGTSTIRCRFFCSLHCLRITCWFLDARFNDKGTEFYALCIGLLFLFVCRVFVLRNKQIRKNKEVEEGNTKIYTWFGPKNLHPHSKSRCPIG